MANNRIQIKRSTTTAISNTTPSVNAGELVFTSNGYILAVGDPANSANVISIGGARYPGILTANQALVANTTSGIDKVIVANLAANSVWANGSAGVAGQVLTSNGTVVYWTTPPAAVSGSDTQVQFNDGGALGADAGFTYNKTTDALTVNGSFNVLTDIIANTIGLFTTGTVNGATLSVGTSVVANSTRLALGAAVGLQANGGIGSAGQILYSNGTTAYWDATPAADITAVTAGNGLTGGGSSGDVTLDIGSGNGISVSADAISVLGGSTLTVNATGVHVNSTLGIQDLTVSGNLTVLGDLVSMNVATLAIEDSLVTLAKDQGSTGSFTDALDIGFVGTYGDTANLFYSGLFRDQSDTGIWKLFTSNGDVTNTNIDTANTSAFKLAILQTYLSSGGLTTNATSANLIANSTYAVGIIANAISLSNRANNDLIFTNGGGALTGLALGVSGYVLQSNGTAIVYDVLDGGTF